MRRVPEPARGAGRSFAAERQRGIRHRPRTVREPVVDEGDRERRRLEAGARGGRRGRAARQLGGDHRPRGVGVAAPQVEAAQARPGAGLDERTDARPGVVEHDGEVRHVATEPRQVPGRRDRPGRGDDRERGVGRRHPRRADARRRRTRGAVTWYPSAVRSAMRRSPSTPSASTMTTRGTRAVREPARALGDSAREPAGDPRRALDAGSDAGSNAGSSAASTRSTSTTAPPRPVADGAEGLDARPVSQRRDQSDLEVARVAQHHAGGRRAELQVGGRAPDEGERGSMRGAMPRACPTARSAARHPSTGAVTRRSSCRRRGRAVRRSAPRRPRRAPRGSRRAAAARAPGRTRRPPRTPRCRHP